MKNTTRLLRLRIQSSRTPTRTSAVVPAQHRRALHTTPAIRYTSSPRLFQASTSPGGGPSTSSSTKATPPAGKAGLGIDQVPISDISGPVTPLSRYNQLVEAGALRDDPHQRTIIEKLEKLHQELTTYHPPPIPTSSSTSGSSWFGNLFSSNSAANHVIVPPDSVPKGMYLFGDVGCGKTMLMDLFYSTLPSHLHSHRRRIHFHAFMLDVFRRVHAIKHGLPTALQPGLHEGKEGASNLKEEIKSFVPLAKERIRKQREEGPMQGRSDERAIGVEALSGMNLFNLNKLFSSSSKKKNGTVVAEEDAIYEAAREMVEEGRILCFDEFQVTDIVTAMILRQLLARMMDYGMVCIITSKSVDRSCRVLV